MEPTDQSQDQPAAPSADAIAQQEAIEKAARDKACVEEFDRYYKEREALAKAELDY